MNNDLDYYQPQSYKLKRRPNAGAVIVLGIIGILTVFAVHPLAGVAILAIASMLERVEHSCGHCGNHVSKNSLVCPTCHAQFTQRAPANISQGIAILIILILMAAGLCMIAALGKLSQDSINKKHKQLSTPTRQP